jgi:hypothetical protein
MGRVMFASVLIRVSDTFCNEEGKVKLPLGRDSCSTPCISVRTPRVLLDESQRLNVNVPAIVAEGGGRRMG